MSRMNLVNEMHNEPNGPDLSRRLLAVAGLVTPGNRIADVGTDHAYVPTYLVLKGIVPGALAMDVGKGPLERARQTVDRYGLSDRIITRLSDGLQKLQPGEAQSIVIAGMGGALTIRILEDQGMETLERIAPDELILAPQSELSMVRAFLRAHNWQIDAENMVLEDGKYYQMMRVRRGTVSDETAGNGVKDDMQSMQDLYGPVLLAQKHPVLLSYLEWEYGVLQNIAKQLKAADSESVMSRKKEVEEKQRLNRLAYHLCISESRH